MEGDPEEAQGEHGSLWEEKRDLWSAGTLLVSLKK